MALQTASAHAAPPPPPKSTTGCRNEHIGVTNSATNTSTTATVSSTTTTTATTSSHNHHHHHHHHHHLNNHHYTAVEQVPNDVLADTVALVLEQFCARGEGSVTLPSPNEPAALFFSPSRQTSFSLSFYIRRLVEYTCCSKSAFVVAVLYLARLAERHPVFMLSDLNVHRLACTSVVLAAKWLDDISYSNAHYARVAGVQSAAEMTRMENHFLSAIDYRLYVAPDNYRDVEISLLNIAASWR